MRSTINSQAQVIIDRLKTINYDEPYWNEQEVIECFKRQYATLGLTMPPVEVANNLVIGFELARGAARDAAWDAARGAAWDAAWGAARDAAWDAAWDAARDAARDAAWDAAWGAARGAAWDAAWDAARGAAWGAAWDAARDAARDAALISGALNRNPNDERVIKFVEIEIEVLKALGNGLDVYFPMKDKLILVPIPRMVIVNERLHYDHGKAVEWRDGKGFYFLRGVQFEKGLYDKIVGQAMKAEEILKISNADQRAVAISMARPSRLLEMLNAHHLNTGKKGTKLYEVKNFMKTGRTEYCMHMIDPSNGREFIEWVEPKTGKQGSADLCQAEAFGISLNQYLEMEQEA